MKHPLVYLPRYVVLLLLLGASASTPTSAGAQLLEVKQTVFGMDCAPCAYGLEKRLRNIEGVQEVRVSLDEGLAATELARNGRVRLNTIREAIRESGFSAEDAVIRARGTLRQENGRWTLVLPSGEHFVLGQLSDSVRRSLKPGPAAITGRVAKGDPDERGGYRLELITIGAS